MKKIEIIIPQNELELESAIVEFIKEEFKQEVEFSTQQVPDVIYKDPNIGAILWQAVQVIAAIEGVLQVSERALRLKRVQKLLASIKKIGKSVYVKIGENDLLDLLGMSVDDIMDLL